jgi:hypothetical protein
MRNCLTSGRRAGYANFHLTLTKSLSILLLNMARDLSRRLRRLDEVFAARH